MRSTCCCPGDVVRVDSCFLHAGRRTVTALEEVLGYSVVGSESVKAGASGVDHTLEEGAHGHGGLKKMQLAWDREKMRHDAIVIETFLVRQVYKRAY